MADRIPLYYTFGNHQHWVDLQWLWGYDVLPGAIRDMFVLCKEAGVKGCVNFDGIGYEKLAAEDPKAFADLKQAVQDGMLEIVGGSYGQPYGLFHGGESNIRQRIFGARAAKRLFGVPVKTFWEEEFDFFPQLPQILRGVGIEYASLFFQWTWHTPEVPREDVPIVWWEGQDGSRLLCATRNRLNLHQWPEDMDIVLAELAEGSLEGFKDGPTPLVLQWLELMPTPDWMCRSELILPKLKQLMADPRFEVRAVTLGEYLRCAGVPPAASSTVPVDDDMESSSLGHGDATAVPVRRYTMDQVWHGMTLGKNGDYMRRKSREVESVLLAAETIAASAGLFGRPYAQWDVYPTWELEEAWRELLSAQHHDNDECEGLCGHVGKFSYEKSESLARHHLDRHVARIAEDLAAPGDMEMLFNPLGWERRWHVVHREGQLTVATVPAFGWTVVGTDAPDTDCGEWVVDGRTATFNRGAVKVVVDLDRATITHLQNSHFPEGLNLGGRPLWEWSGTDADGNPLKVRGRDHFWDGTRVSPQVVGSRMIRLSADFEGYPDHGMTIGFAIEPHNESLHVMMEGTVPDLAPGMNPSFTWRFPVLGDLPQVKADTPLGVQRLTPNGVYPKKYPEGDWMTSPQWFEQVHSPFTGSSFVDFTDEGERGLHVAFAGARQWLAEGDAVRCILNANDPWDENEVTYWFQHEFLLTLHGRVSDSDLWKAAQEFVVPCEEEYKESEGKRIPATFAPVSCDAENVALTAFYRETRDSAKGQNRHAADLLGIDYPYVLRLVELDGVETETNLTFGATIGGAVRTNLLGEPQGELIQEPKDSKLSVHLRPYEIATLYLDLVEGRKQVRDLDAKREIWATVHRVD